jgi:hypothetical protein
MDNFFFKLSIMLVPGLFAITCHEVSHGYIACATAIRRRA